MASISRPRPYTEPRSGGKMVRPRRTAAPKTPYDRPALSPNPTPQNPNWLARYIYSPTRIIATGAGKILSSVFTGDSSSSSSSSSEDDIDGETDDNHISSKAADASKKVIAPYAIFEKRAIEVIQGPSEPSSIVEKTETKNLIERLIMQVTFSREEFYRLTSIIKSRVVDSPVNANTKNGRLSELSNRTVGNDVDMPDLCGTAVMEAKKWLEEKKLGLNSKSELELGTCTLNSAMLPHGSDGEAGSPVDMAKSYMKTRPPWASPSANHTEYRLPSPTRIQLFKDDAPYSIGFSSLSNKMKRDSPSSGSWNISEELRKVRSKATEDMLRTLPSSKIDWFALTSENRSVFNSSVADEVEGGSRDKVISFTKSVDASLNLAAGVTTSNSFPVSQVTQAGLQSEPLPQESASFISEQKQLLMRELEDIQTIEKTREGRLSSGQRFQPREELKNRSQSDADAATVDGLKDINGTSQPFETKMGEDMRDLGLHDENCTTSKEISANGFPPSGSRLSAGQDRERNDRPPDEKQNVVGSAPDKVTPSVPMGEACEFLSEASIEVPITCEIESVGTGSQNSSSMPSEGLSQGLTTNIKRSVAGKTSGATEKQQGKKISRYNRRGRGRGKQ